MSRCFMREGWLVFGPWMLRQCIKNSKWSGINTGELNVKEHVISIHYISMFIRSKPGTYLFSCIDTSFMHESIFHT